MLFNIKNIVTIYMYVVFIFIGTIVICLIKQLYMAALYYTPANSLGGYIGFTLSVLCA